MFILPKAIPEEFRRDVIAVARKVEATIIQSANDFGVSPASLHRWFKIPDREDGVASGAVSDDAAKLREAINAFGSGIRKPWAVPGHTCPGTSTPKMTLMTLLWVSSRHDGFELAEILAADIAFEDAANFTVGFSGSPAAGNVVFGRDGTAPALLDS